MDNYQSTRCVKKFLQDLSIAEEPFAVMSTDTKPATGYSPNGKSIKHRCVMSFLHLARKKNEAAFFARDQIFCPGGQLYLNTIDEIPECIAHFVSTGLEGFLKNDHDGSKQKKVQPFLKSPMIPPNASLRSIIKGERFCRDPEIVFRFLERIKLPADKRKYRVFKPLSMVRPEENPDIIVFFTNPDVLAGLYNLVQFYSGHIDSVVSPWGAGCTAVYGWVKKFMLEGKEKAVLGGFDILARSFLDRYEVTFSMPYSMFLGMLNCYRDSFICTRSWKILRKRIINDHSRR